MKKLYQNPKVLQILLAVWLVLTYLPALKLTELSTPNGGIPVSLCYLFSVVFLPFLAFQLPKLRIPPWYITGLYLYVIAWAVIQASAHGLSKSILHWLFGAFVLLVLANVGEYLSKEQLGSVLQVGILVFVLCHLIYNLIHWQGIYEVVAQGQIASSLGSLTRGGRNLDATWLGLGCFLIKDKRLRFGCLLYSLAYAVIGVSRVGIVATGLCLLWMLVYDERYGFRKNTALLWSGLAVAGLGIAFALGLAQRMINRMFLGYGEGSVSFLAGREAMWQNLLPMFKAHPFGVGAGNALPVMRSEFGFSSYEDVMHNVFFQWLLDGGLIGALWFVALAVLLFYSQRSRKTGWFREPLAAYLLVYLVLSLVQFHGGEALMIFTLGCFLVSQGKWVQIRWPWQKPSQAKEPVGAK